MGLSDPLCQLTTWPSMLVVDDLIQEPDLNFIAQPAGRPRQCGPGKAINGALNLISEGFSSQSGHQQGMYNGASTVISLMPFLFLLQASSPQAYLAGEAAPGRVTQAIDGALGGCEGGQERHKRVRMFLLVKGCAAIAERHLLAFARDGRPPPPPGTQRLLGIRCRGLRRRRCGD